MNKRYQVFVSSTYADLQQERRKVIQTLMEMDCIPAGMELFPAADDEQWEFIKRVIDDCDYYVLIIGGRYGSLTSEGISYTEKEHNYAMSIGLKVLTILYTSLRMTFRLANQTSTRSYERSSMLFENAFLRTAS